MIPIILTGTIVPQSNFTKINDWKLRRKEYLDSIDHYLKFNTNIFFLENSSYDIESDPLFKHKRLHVIKYNETLPDAYQRGKGFQEFKMIDSFIESNTDLQYFFKITGRRIIRNFSSIYNKYIQLDKPRFDISTKEKTVDTSFFFCNREFYLSEIKNNYQFVNDETGMWIEKVLYNNLINNHETLFHFPYPNWEGVSGSTGEILKQQKWKIALRNMQRKTYIIFGKRKL